MSDKIKVPLRFQVQVEERFHQPAHKRWRAQFSFYPLGWFRGDSHSPAAAVAIAWRNFRREVDPDAPDATRLAGPELGALAQRAGASGAVLSYIPRRGNREIRNEH